MFKYLFKNILWLLLITFFITVNTLAQDTIDTNKKSLNGFLDIKWGESKESAKQKYSKREGVKLDKKYSNDKMLIFDGGKFGGEKIGFVKLIFFQNKFHTAIIYFEKPLESKTIEKYRDIKEMLITKYGNPENDFEFFKDPYYNEQYGMETTIIKMGKGVFSSYWDFPSLENGEKNTISLRIDEELDIKLTYQNGSLTSKASDEEEKKNLNDY
jgi:hypothetical protein